MREIGYHACTSSPSLDTLKSLMPAFPTVAESTNTETNSKVTYATEDLNEIRKNNGDRVGPKVTYATEDLDEIRKTNNDRVNITYATEDLAEIRKTNEDRV